MPQSAVLKKRCGKCQKKKEVCEFARNKQTSDGWSWQCKSCHAQYVKAHQKANPNYYRGVQLRYKYGITLDQYLKMHKKQKGLCKICGNPEFAVDRNGVVKMLAVDHDEETGRIRGLLCQTCNIGIGNLQHDINRLQSAIRYLNESAVAIS